MCATCNKPFGTHHGSRPNFLCPDEKGTFTLPPLKMTPTAAEVEAKKEATSREWLEDAYCSYGHHGCCAVCDRGWNRGGEKGDAAKRGHRDIFPLNGARKAPKLFHLACLEKVKDTYSNTWLKYQHWKETGEVHED